jgi:C1A family cysteine protease
MKQNLAQIFTPSRLFIYYNERAMEGTVNSDSGAQIRDGMKSVGSQGVCPEDMWPYIIANFADKPPDACYQAALQHKAILYQRVVRDLIQMKGCLASGYPFVFGFTVYESFESQQVAQTGHAPMPQHGEKVLGGHAVMAVGYDDANQWFIAHNSWGTSWGMQGYFTLPYAYFTSRNLSSDFWTVRLVQ